MNDFEEKLKSFLDSPESMEKVLNIMKSISGGEAEQTANYDNDTEKSEASEHTESVPAIAPAKPDTEASRLFGEFDSFDPKMVSMAMQMMNEYNSKNDRRIHLLNALRPYFKTDEQSHIEKAMQIIKLAKVAKRALNNFSGGETNV